MEYEPKYLGKRVTEAVEKIDLIPWDRGLITVHLDCLEFTSKCPVTNQPDFAQFEIEYIPRQLIVETKSVKLYLMKFRERKEFNEKLVAEIAEDWFKQLQPEWLKITGRFNLRGGIAVTATVEKGQK